MSDRSEPRISRGVHAAYGPRRRWQSAARTRITWELLRVSRRRRTTTPADYIEFVPGSRDARVVADVSGRVNWYLKDRGEIPIYMAGAHDVSFGPGDAPYLDPELVTDPGWAVKRPAGVAEVVLHDVNVRSLPRFLRGAGHCSLASATFSMPAERGWFALQQRYGTTQTSSAEAVGAVVAARYRRGATALVLATGPSAKAVDAARVTADIRITCNSAVRDHGLLLALQPDVIAFADRVFHFGPSRYASAFRADLRFAMESTDATFVTIADWAGPLLAHVPEIAPRLVVLDSVSAREWHWPTPAKPWIRATGNVLTSLMLPMAFALADDVQIAGCDGRDPDERYFWKHNASTQYTDELMEAAFAAHPAFFADRDYVDYYDEHCRDLEALLSTAERAGKTSSGLTPSHIPALRARGAPRFPSRPLR